MVVTARRRGVALVLVGVIVGTLSGAAAVDAADNAGGGTASSGRSSMGGLSAVAESWQRVMDELEEWTTTKFAGMDWREAVAKEGMTEALPWNDLPLSHPISPLVGIVSYFSGILALKLWMDDREPMAFPRLMLVHNMFLAVMSAVMFAGVSWTMAGLFWQHGFNAVWNDPQWVLPQTGVGAWCYAFYVSKYYELLDSLFLVLKKRTPEFVQLWHHAVVLVLFWGYMEARMMNHVWLVWANCFVHVFVYGYFAAATLRIEVWFKPYITKLQISQFVFDMGYSFPFYYFKNNDMTRGDWEPWYFGQFIGLTFVVLFTQILIRINAARKAKAAKARAAKSKDGTGGAKAPVNGNSNSNGNSNGSGSSAGSRRRGASPAPRRRAARQ